ncbi:MAG: phosphatase PAP2 family protein [Elusimicrobiales bacterium]|nr:phosphatase PAP2 family protein [Elusimicrobiales bacterium]
MKFKKTQLLLAAAALALGACGPKPAVRGPEHQSQAAPKVYYVNPEPYKSLRFAPPPAPGSLEQQADIAGVLAWQNKRTEEDCARARRTADEDYDAFWGGRSPFPEPPPAELKEFFVRLAGDLEASLGKMKKRYLRPRPFMAYSEAQPCIKKPKSFSYPSGHTVFSRVYALVLADIVPDRKAEFFAKADEIAQDRVIGGVHYPADIAAGKAFGDLYFGELQKSEAYRRDIERLRALLAK